MSGEKPIGLTHAEVALEAPMRNVETVPITPARPVRAPPLRHIKIGGEQVIVCDGCNRVHGPINESFDCLRVSLADARAEVVRERERTNMLAETLRLERLGREPVRRP